MQDVSNNKKHAEEKMAGRCECGRYARDQRANVTLVVAGQRYDTVMSINSGLDANVQHAYSPALGKCVAIKHCVEQTDRLNKCTRELEVLKALSGKQNPHLVQLFDSEVLRNQTCQASSTMSDYLRMIVIGSNRRRRSEQRRSDHNHDDSIPPNADEMNSTPKNICTEVITVMELGQENVFDYWQKKMNKTNNNKNNITMLESEVRTQIQKALDGLHGMGLAHRDVTRDNVLLFPRTEDQQRRQMPFLVKLIDFGWSCCFDATKCGGPLSAVLPQCDPDDALPDDRFGLNDLIQELHKTKTTPAR